MELISEKVVEKTWKEAANISPQHANKEILKVGQSQPELLAFLMESTDDLSSEAQELTIYLFFVIYRMFHTSGTRIRRVTSREITECHDKNQNLLKDLESQDAFFDKVTTFQVLSQPYVMKYVSEALLEEEEDFSGLSEEENRLLFLLMKTVVDALDKAG